MHSNHYILFFDSYSISLDLASAALTAWINAFLIPNYSNFYIAAIVEPPGEATLSFKTPGCVSPFYELSSTILAAPSTVFAANLREFYLDNPAFTPPSAIASIIMKIYAGALPLMPTIPCMCFY